MSTWIFTDAGPGSGPRVAVKDLIDMAGLPTTAGSRPVADRARPAERDAACLAGLRAAIGAGRARFAGKTNLHELAYGISGVNPAFGTPVNPLDPRRVPGGSSSGSGTAVAAGEADIAYGTDTGGSIRIPAACCGIAGLKTTWGRIPLDGVRPLARDLDTVGPMARDVAGVIAGLTLLEPGFTPAPSAPRTVGVLAVDADPRITDAARRVIARWRETLDALWTRVDLLATPTLLGFPPLLDEAHRLFKLRVLTSPVNAAGVPSLALPVPVRGRNAGPFPASIQLIGPRYSEEKLLAAGLRLEQAVGG